MRTPALAAAAVALAVLLLFAGLHIALSRAIPFDPPRLIASLLTLPPHFLARGEGAGHASPSERLRSFASPQPGFAGASPSAPPASREPPWSPARSEKW